MPVSKKRKKASKKTLSEKQRREAEARKRREKIGDMADTLKFLHDTEQSLLQQWLDEQGAVDPRPCKGENRNVCVAEGCDGQACIEKIEEITE